ncbi:MAG TPA: gamma-glutamyl-gamma-aminobutyrate hydrolase family protein [Chloroflexota bacterium]|jgi:putative glutamine amidotransferase|nr:gamma-glutamyl-gamma-aminobutyrate hydrolase family protein [Chloroflexota bacterium]
MTAPPERPLIGITTGPLPPRPPYSAGLRQNRAYAQAIAAAGGLPVLLPLLDDAVVLRALYARLDGLLLPGGGDVAPERYGQVPRPDCAVEGVDAQLDRVELQLARWALDEGLPILGICRGQQVLNVAAGGTLLQDITREAPGSLVHRRPEARRELVHPIAVAGDSRLAAVLGAVALGVNSIHHQAVARLAPGVRAVAWAPDGVIEGVEVAAHPFALAVQFHPEELVPAHAPSARLFCAFVAACAQRRAG